MECTAEEGDNENEKSDYNTKNGYSNGNSHKEELSSQVKGSLT